MKLVVFIFCGLLMVQIIIGFKKVPEFNSAKDDEHATMQKAGEDVASINNNNSTEEKSKLQTGDSIESKAFDEDECELENTKQTIEGVMKDEGINNKEVNWKDIHHHATEGINIKEVMSKYSLQMENGQQPLIVVISNGPQGNHEITLCLVTKDGEAEPKSGKQTENKGSIQPTTWWRRLFQYLVASLYWLSSNAIQILGFVSQLYGFWERYNRRYHRDMEIQLLVISSSGTIILYSVSMN
ncbi:uncharacterized protein LOC117125183 [Anneissia japonica]|uniref:uncharacterized protein LOC117125183 n=1 Tax=Anneissia japonica TaxID=1529436 RepID=UPI0014258D08|nr:uncharacterized protein LOC117125183 [Anneissia japonica]